MARASTACIRSGRPSVGDLVQRRVKGADEAFRRRCFELTAGNPLQLRELLVALERAEEPADEATLQAGAAAAARSLERSVVRPARRHDRAGAGTCRGGRGVRGRRPPAPRR